jgi:hypothetical protein
MRLVQSPPDHSQTAALKALVGKSLKKIGPYKPTARLQTSVNSIMCKGSEKYLVVCWRFDRKKMDALFLCSKGLLYCQCCLSNQSDWLTRLGLVLGESVVMISSNNPEAFIVMGRAAWLLTTSSLIAQTN